MWDVMDVEAGPMVRRPTDPGIDGLVLCAASEANGVPNEIGDMIRGSEANDDEADTISLRRADATDRKWAARAENISSSARGGSCAADALLVLEGIARNAMGTVPYWDGS
jgi:hypothetical protein